MVTPELVDRIRQSLQVIMSESDNVRARTRQLGIKDEDLDESTDAIAESVRRIEAAMTAEKGVFFVWKVEPPCRSGRVGGFNDFRRRVSRSLDMDLDRWWNAGGPRLRHEGEDIEALRPLLMHSDCEGDLSPAECAQVAPVLRRVVEAWKGDYDNRPMRFVELLEECAAKGLTIEFC